MPNAAFILAPFAFDDVYGEKCLADIESAVTVLRPIVSREELANGHAPNLGETDLLFTSWGAPVLDEALLDQMPRLQAVFFGAGSVRDMVTDAFWARNITLTSAAAINAQPVAEYTLGAIMLSLKRALPQARAVRQLRGYPEPPLSVPGGYRATIGLVSFGRIGRQLRQLLRPFDLRVIAYDPVVPESELRTAGVEPVSLEQLFTESDIVSLHTPWLPATEGLISGALVDRMKAGATLINTSRGAIVREPELAAVLARRTDLQAILDVTWPEPPRKDSLLYQLPNVLLTPHIAGSIGPERRRIGQTMVAEMKRFLRGDPLLFEVERTKSRLQA